MFSFKPWHLVIVLIINKWFDLIWFNYCSTYVAPDFFGDVLDSPLKSVVSLVFTAGRLPYGKACFVRSTTSCRHSVWTKCLSNSSDFCYCNWRITAWRLSVCRVHRAYKSRTERPRKTKIGTDVGHVTSDSDTTFRVKRSKVKTLIGYTGRPTWTYSNGYLSVPDVNRDITCRPGRGISWRPPTYSFLIR